MKQRLFLLIALTVAQIARSQISDPLAGFKNGLTIAPGDQILRWECDMNGDRKNEVFFSLASDHDKDLAHHQPPGWNVYIAVSGKNTYIACEGLEISPGRTANSLPDIDLDLCFVGEIEKLGKRGIVTMRIDNPRTGPPVAKIYAYTIEGHYLKKVDLLSFDPTKSSPPLFEKYLADNKRTRIQVQRVAP